MGTKTSNCSLVTCLFYLIYTKLPRSPRLEHNCFWFDHLFLSLSFFFICFPCVFTLSLHIKSFSCLMNCAWRCWCVLAFLWVCVCVCVRRFSLTFYHKNNIDLYTLYIYIGSQYCWFVILFVQHTHTHAPNVYFQSTRGSQLVASGFPFWNHFVIVFVYFLVLFFALALSAAFETVYHQINRWKYNYIHILIACMCNGWRMLVCAICAKTEHTLAV